MSWLCNQRVSPFRQWKGVERFNTEGARRISAFSILSFQQHAAVVPSCLKLPQSLLSSIWRWQSGDCSWIKITSSNWPVTTMVVTYEQLLKVGIPKAKACLSFIFRDEGTLQHVIILGQSYATICGLIHCRQSVDTRDQRGQCVQGSTR